jgi:drug/metabolite transporter (DMT)-like permease
MMKEAIAKAIAKTPGKNYGGIALVWVSIAWGTTWLVSKQGVTHMPAIQLAGIRQIIGGLAFVLFFIVRRHAWPKGKQWRGVLILSFLNFMISNGLSTLGVKYISSGLGSIIGAIFPLWLAIILLVRGGAVPRVAVLGILLGFAGICIIFYDHLHDFLNPDFRIGIALSLTATISWAFGTLYTKSEALNFNPYFSLGLQMLISGAVLTGCAEFSGTTIAISEIPPISWWAIAYLTVIGSIITFVAYLYALQKLHATLTSVYAYINPVVAVLLGAYFLSEKINIYIIVGGAVTLLGVYMVNTAFRKLPPGKPN